MSSAAYLLHELDERTIAPRFVKYHVAIDSFADKFVPIASYADAMCVIGNGLNHIRHVCDNAPPAPPYRAQQEARELLEDHYRHDGRSFVQVIEDAKLGTNGGLRGILNNLADILRQQDMHQYREHLIGELAQESYDRKLELVRELIRHLGPNVPAPIDPTRPEKHVHAYKSLIYAVLDARRRVSSASLS